MRPIAIVGMDCRFPGAADLAGYWDLLTRSGDGVGEVPQQRWDARAFYSAEGAQGHANTTQGGFIADVDAFDNEFFTISPREAAVLDPQQRLLLQTAWRAIEDAGIAPQRLAGTNAGVFIGIMGNEWAQLSVTDYANLTAQAISGNGYCMTANRISYHLDLKGQSLAVDTACSSSLVAVHLAANALLAGECDYALAGGVNVAVTPSLSIFYTQAGLSAPDGRCKPFSADANGIGRGEGVGVVVLRRLEDAIADGQRVYAVIRGSAVNQDGRSNGITAPNRWSQREVIAAAYRRAEVEPEDVAFLEAHGTGTQLGDRIETNALGDLHAGRAKPLVFGSVKGNLGHTEGAAGIAGLIKVALSLHHRMVPASRFAAKENPALQLADRGLKLLKAPLRLSAKEPAIAGLSSFGLGGTNAHAVLESAPVIARTPLARTSTGANAGSDTASGIGAGVFTLTASSPEGLRRNLLVQAEAVARQRGRAAALCWASNEVKTGQRYRYAVAADDTRDLAEALRAAAEDPAVVGADVLRPKSRPKLAFLFTGQGSQFPKMTMRLAAQAPLYRGFLHEADEALRPHAGESVLDLIASGDERIHHTGFAQPALFAVGYALARTLSELGIEPAYLLGHSVGEYVAATLAEVFPLEAAAQLIATRGALMQELPAGGGMLSVQADPADVEELIADEPLVGIGAVNGPRSTVLSGDLTALGRVAAALKERRVRSQPLTVSHAFHSPLMEPMLERFAAVAEQVGGGVPRLPIHSTVYGRALSKNEAMDAEYWTRHVSAPVLFADAAERLLEVNPAALIEVGPKPILSSLIRRIGAQPGRRALHPAPREESGARDLAGAVAELFRVGVDPEWSALYDESDRRRFAPLAPYSFSAAHRYWSHKPVTVLQPDADDQLGWDAAPWTSQQLDGATPAKSQPADAPAGAAAAGGDPVWEAVVSVISQVGDYLPSQISPRSRLYEDLGFDSVMAMELRDRLESRLSGLGSLSTQELLAVMATAGELAEYLRSRYESTTSESTIPQSAISNGTASSDEVEAAR
ncbi:type I polyketide synthase [Actinocrinis sp.]|uniref:type I polyketide synthase n=1 Tax=Actinocrinis sp. TaxID=1920516 RepID=UPI002D59F6B6|nr:beta-ketoacyl synthase N-terminal-like domain-containing protein [Actinocrinis sp.]HZP51614.1 beta-ketoacyl synthase N-terminal-like domain-containing protein [Actinocrinis sp.]